MNLKPFLFTTLLGITSTSYATPPFIDYQWKVSLDACLERADSALITTGFKPSGSTGESEVVGFKGDYKGVIACVGRGSDIAVFIVAGPNYEQARKWALKMKENF